MGTSLFAKQLVASIGELPAIDPVVEKVLTLVSDPSTSPKALAEVIQGDVALSTRILQLSNSAIFGLTRQVSSIDHAVFILGYNEIRNLALLSSTFDLVKRGGMTDILISLWNHLLTTAICARSLSRKFLKSVTSLAYVSGLLHDIGKIPFALKFPTEYSELFEQYGNLPEKCCRLKWIISNVTIRNWANFYSTNGTYLKR
jgi:HD-like signal output (HDOD) protein